MKSLTSLGVIACICLFSITVNAQQKTPPLNQVTPVKPSLFGNLPQKFPVSIDAVEKIFSAAIASTIKIPFSNTVFFEGIVVDKIQQNPHALTVNIQSANFKHALLSISKITTDEHTVSYIARLMSIENGDVLLLTTERDQLFFTRQKQSIVIVE